MSGFQLTDEQSRATNPASHIWVDASAGTGKTHVLAARVLRLMAVGNHPASILCLTYTKAAAGEMTNRILGHLGRWATQDDTALRQELGLLLGGTSNIDEAALQRARRLFLDVLDLPMGLNVQTLHAFSQSLLGRFPLEARTAPGFETIDARTAEELLGSSRDDLLAKAVSGADPALSQATQNLARLLADKSFNETLSALRGAAVQLQGLPKNRAGLQRLIEEALDLKPGQSRDQVLKAACQEVAFDGPGLRAVLGSIHEAGTEPEKNKVGTVLATWLAADPAERADRFDEYALVYLTVKQALRKKFVTAGVTKRTPDAAEIMQTEAERILTVLETKTLIQVAHQTTDALLFGQSLIERYGAQKDNAGKLDFDDLIARTSALLDAADIPTWVMYKLDTQIDHILIDEAQDNSDVQWRIIERITQDFFSGSDPERQRSIFAVGDMKQSIYGFQGAQPKLFDSQRGAVDVKAKQAQQRFEEVPIAQSFRSVSAVLEVVDETFAGAAGDGLDAQRVTLKHNSYRKGMGGQVDLWPILDMSKDKEADEGWRLPLFERTQEKADRALAAQIAEDIHAKIKAKERLPSRAEPLEAGDFLILVRRRGDFMGHMARALKRRGIALAGIDRFDLKSPLVIRDLINMARFACLPQDDFTLACVLKSPFCNVTEETLMQLCVDRGEASLWSYIQASGAVEQDVLETLRRVLRRADFIAPYEFFSALLLEGGRMALLERLGVEADDAIDVFLNQCMVYERGHAPSLDGFLHWFAQSDVDVQRDAESAGDKVRIMTVHGAKGLQAPVVYLPDLVGLPKPNYPFVDVRHTANGKTRQLPIFRRSSSGDVGKIAAETEALKIADYEEYKRLLYVAMTRAEDHLICCGFRNKQASDKEKKELKDTRKDAYELVADAFDRLDRIEDIGDGRRRYGRAQRVPVSLAQTGPSRDIQGTSLPGWARAPAPQEATPPRPLQPSDAGMTAPRLFDAAQPQDMSAAKRGTLVHTLLEHLPTMPAGLREDAALAYLDKQVPASAQALKNDLARQAIETLALPELAPLFAKDSRREVPLVARLGNFIVSGQIDRLAITGDTVIFVDYKTTAAPPERQADIAPAYLRQMALYHASLQQMFPRKTVIGGLIWTVSGRVDWLDYADLAVHLPKNANSAFS